MVLVLIGKGSNCRIGEMDVDFIPEVGDHFVYSEGTPGELVVSLDKVLKPTLIRGSIKHVKCIVSKHSF